MLLLFAIHNLPRSSDRQINKQESHEQVASTAVAVSPQPETLQPIEERPQEALTQQPVEQPKPVEIPVPAKPSTKEDLMRQAGIPESEFNAVDYIVTKESTWRHTAVNASSGARGLCQSLPASKMASEGEDYMTNPVTQLRWCHRYATHRYGGWFKAMAFWQTNRWW